MNEVEHLKAQVAALEELLMVYEQSSLEQSRKLERACAKSKERAHQLQHAQGALQTLQSILDSMGDGVVVVDQAGELLFSNPAAAEILGIDLTNLSLREWAAQRHLCSSDPTADCLQDLPLARAMQGESVAASEFCIQNATTHQECWISATARPLQDETGNPGGSVTVFRDITQRKQTESARLAANVQLRAQTHQLQSALEELRQTQAQLIQNEKMSSLGQLVAGIAHEINNPVNFVYGNLSHVSQYTQDLLGLIAHYQRQFPDPGIDILTEIEQIDLDFIAEDLPKLLTSMRIGADRIRQIIVSLRNFSRLDEAEQKNVDIHEGLDSTMMILQNRLKGRPGGWAIQVIKQYGSLPRVECYPGPLNQVFMNILTNAIDALEEQEDREALRQKGSSLERPLHHPSTITVTTTAPDPQRVTIRIADNGPGISEAVQRRLFDPFFTTKGIGKGTGLGMSISHQIITDRHGGKLSCVSTPGGGTEFVIEIPVRLAVLSAQTA